MFTCSYGYMIFHANMLKTVLIHVSMSKKSSIWHANNYGQSFILHAKNYGQNYLIDGNIVNKRRN